MVLGLNELRPETIKYTMKTNIKKRAYLGQFFIPKSLCEELIRKIPKLHNPAVLDPAYGTGEFLLFTKEHFVNPEALLLGDR